MIRKTVMISFLLLTILLLPAKQAAAAEKSQVISKVNTTEKVIALTFDDGSDGEHIQEILDILIVNEVKATFFLTGSAAKVHPKLLKSILDNGNSIGNHSYSHPYFTKLTAKQMKKELTKSESVIKKITGQYTKPFFRPPYGDYNSSVLRAVGSAGYSYTITWTIDTLDWKGRTAAAITKKVLEKASPGSIVLMHAGGGAVNTPAALPGIIKSLKEQGYQFVTIPELIGYISEGDNYYTVKAGDNLTKISRIYGVTVQQLVDANHIKNPNLIYTGEVLIIPAAEPAA
jgi:polysaccharide deacetylase family sporulation protein PdaB